MRRRLWGVVLVVVLVATLGMAAVMGVAAYGPFDPGDGALYRGQRVLEEILVRLQTSPKNKARQRIRLARRRIRDVERLAGGAAKRTALTELDQAVREAVHAASVCPQSDAGDLRLDLLSVLQNTEQVLARVASRADAWIETLIDIPDLCSVESHPVRMRGLTPPALRLRSGTGRSHPVRMRGLKCRHARFFKSNAYIHGF